jgi:hypothetical protein
VHGRVTSPLDGLSILLLLVEAVVVRAVAVAEVAVLVDC